jgi:hypothetical protein
MRAIAQLLVGAVLVLVPLGPVPSRFRRSTSGHRFRSWRRAAVRAGIAGQAERATDGAMARARHGVTPARDGGGPAPAPDGGGATMAALQAIGAAPGAIAATRPIMGLSQTAAGNRWPAPLELGGRVTCGRPSTLPAPASPGRRALEEGRRRW